MTTRLAALSRSYWDDAARLDRMPEFEAGGLTGPMWPLVFRAARSAVVAARGAEDGSCDE